MIKKIYDKNQFTGYFISDSGTVFTTKNPRNPGLMLPLSPFRQGGVLSVELRVDGSRRYHSTIERLVASAYVPNPHNLPLVRPMDGDRDNLCADNLIWCSRACLSCSRTFKSREEAEMECSYCREIKNLTLRQHKTNAYCAKIEAFGIYNLIGTYRTISQLYLAGCAVRDIATQVMVSEQYAYKVVRTIAAGKVPQNNLSQLTPAQKSAADKANKIRLALRERNLPADRYKELSGALQSVLFDLEDLGSFESPVLDEFVQECWYELEQNKNGFELLTN